MLSSKFWNGRRVFVAGRNGRLGAWLCLMLQQLNARTAGFGADATPGSLSAALAVDAIVPAGTGHEDVASMRKAMSGCGAEIVFCFADDCDPTLALDAAAGAQGIQAIVVVDALAALANGGDVRVLHVSTGGCIGGDLAETNLPAVDRAPAYHALDALHGCLLVAEKAVGQAPRSRRFDFGPASTTASALEEIGWAPALGWDEAAEWDEDLSAAFRRGDDARALAAVQVETHLGQRVRFESPFPDDIVAEDADALRSRILDLVGRYHALAHRKPGFDPVRPNAPVSGRIYGARDMQSLVDSALDFWLTTGRFNAEFEKKLAQRVGAKHALTVNSGSSANLVAFSALTSHRLKDRQLQPGDEVITCATGFPTTINPILQNGMVPVFVDVDIPTYNATPQAIEAAIGPRTRAVMMAHTLGNPFDVRAVKEICDRHGLFLIEDCCDALGATVGGRHVGTFGDIGTLSFYPAHHITMGEGGAVFTNSANLNKVMESFRDWGRDCYCAPGADDSCHKRFGWKLGDLPKGYDHKYVYSHLGYNLKITDMQAAVGLSQLDSLEDFIDARRTNFDRLREGLASLEHAFVLPQATADTEPSWFGFPLTLRADAPVDRHALMLGLQAANIGTRLLFGGNLVRQPYMKGRNFRIAGELANADVVVDRTFWIGVYPGLDARAVDYMIDTLHKLCRGAARAVA